MNFKRLIKDYFTFSKKERNGIIVLLLIILALAIVNRIIFLFEKPTEQDVEKFMADVAEFEKQQGTSVSDLTLFPFDPNTLADSSFNKLSIPEQVKRNMLKFRSKGGVFYNTEDVRKIYGMNDSVFAVIKDYITIKKKTKEEHEEPKKETRYREETKPLPNSTFFAFDPNTCTHDDLSKLGLTERQIQTFYKYRKAIGRFESKEQFAKIYGIDKNLIDSLMQYINIVSAQNEKLVSKRKTTSELVELNTADSLKLQEIKGIGGVLSRRIIKYRQLLGGFYSTDQLLEIYGFNPEMHELIIQQIFVDTTKIVKLDINFCSMPELSKHPYIGKELARKIINFRSKNGSISSTNILFEKKVLKVDEYKKIRPYIGTKYP